ncbi:polysaccharide deacetylase family protein [Lysobacter sp. S4-A87]|uniref:polysaccharide deacetylase family protein n=1 Tax=Lysobacter sp. S4-A87 TaxID=2925843 RepID=UPI001F52EC96|nr:polysaccharide deacetylase family protein [Lysobacter sp. S4-A87]UNK50270.1 polysaccharide deacetylase family protein [Lysobacter sp. S4-A87]
MTTDAVSGPARLPILMYHGLHVDADSRGRFDPVYSVEPDRFARQLDWIQAQGLRSMLLDEAMQQRGDRAVVISFDDGDVSNVEVALPQLLERGMKAEFFITTGFIGATGMLSADEVRELAAAGMGIGSHGCSHAFLEDLDTTALMSELDDSRCRLQALSRRPVEAIALPGGRGGERELRAAQSLGYQHLLGSVPGPNLRARGDCCLQRLAITRNLGMDDFAALVRWQGLSPRLLQARHAALSLPKRVLGNKGYERLRERLL